MSITVKVDLPSWVVIDNSVLSKDYGIGRVMSGWRNTLQVEFLSKDGKLHIGNYTVGKHSFREPTLSEWIERAMVLGDIDDPINYVPGTKVVFKKDYSFNYPLSGQVFKTNIGWIKHINLNAADDETMVFVYLADYAYEDLEEWDNVLELTRKEAQDHIEKNERV